MPGNSEFLKYKQTIGTTSSEAYRAFTSPTALTEWLCNQALVKPIPSGNYYLWWQSGYSVTGEFTELSPDKNVSFTWMGKDDPNPTKVCVTIKPKPEGVQVTLIHCGLGDGKKWKLTRREIDKGWQESLENLKTMLESGQDLRLLRRPMMGITGCEGLSEATASKHNFPKSNGLLLYGVLDGMGAQNAGLQPGDILVKMGGKKLNQDADLHNVISQHQAGDKVKVTYYRNGEKHNTELTFSERLHVEIPPKPADLATQLDAMYKPLLAQLENTLKGISEERATTNPAQGEWNIKQTMAHLIAGEKDAHSWIAALLEDQDSGFEYHVNKIERLNALISACPTMSALIKDLKRNIAETVALISNLPPGFVAHKRSYTRLGEEIFNGSYHYLDHIDQIKKIIDKNVS
jgi:uncharacterized protein YndB with AHSA1/START domain